MLEDNEFSPSFYDFPIYSDVWVDGSSCASNSIELDENRSSMMDSLATKPVTTWTTDEILYWFTKQPTYDKYFEDMRLENCVDIKSEAFIKMDKDEFVGICESETDGAAFYNAKESLISSCSNDSGNISNDNEELFPEGISLVLQDQQQSRLSCSNSECSDIVEPVRRKPGRPKSSNVVRTKSEKRYGRVWEFLINLLQDTNTCPSLIKWDNYNEGTFKFVQAAKVAQLWGERNDYKKNRTMNYEKLSRAIRYHYGSKVLQPVTGKRLVYRFGPQATGWRSANPIL